MRAHHVVPHSHVFPLYAADPVFIEMMAALGVTARPGRRRRRPRPAAARGRAALAQISPASGLDGSA